MEKGFFGASLDMSRNAVMKPQEVVEYAKLLRSFGYNMLQLYLEDTYEIEGEPYFGHMRGRYTEKELSYIVDECQKLDIEVIPCIQTLGHLNQMFVWKHTYEKIRDIDDILLIGDEKTYELIDKMFKTLKKSFRSKYVNIGIDEAYNAGRGKYFDKNGTKEHIDVLLEHLHRVVKIAKDNGFKPMMWADLFACFSFGAHYVEDKKFPEELKSRIPEDLILIHWDYSHNYQKIYDDMISAFQGLEREVWYAGGACCWVGFASGNYRTLENMSCAMKSAREHNVENVMITLWHDNGAECSYYSMLPSLYACKRFYDGVVDIEKIKTEFEDITGENFDRLCSLDLPNFVGGNHDPIGNVSKYMFYSDPFNGLFDAACKKGVTDEYKVITNALRENGKDSKYKYLFDSSAALTDVLSNKYDLGVRTREAYLKDDKCELTALIDEYRLVLQKIEVFYKAYRNLWYKENKPCGFDVQDIRIGGLKQRLSSCIDRLVEYVGGEIDEIPELNEKPLDLFGGGEVIDNTETSYHNRWRFIVSANEL